MRADELERRSKINELKELISFVEGITENEARRVIERYTDEKLEEELDFYRYVSDK